MAIMFDADNVPARLAGAILDEIRRAEPLGVAVDRRVYGDFSSTRTDGWKTAALRLGLETRMQASPSRSKNATDIALVIDAMDVLHARGGERVEVDTFVIVTNDGDFAPLAQRLRRSGKRVVAVGSAASSLVVCCDAHIEVDFARVPARQDPDDVQTLVAMCHELMCRGADRAPAGSDSDVRGGGEDPPWVNVSDLAQHVDRRKPGWRRKLMGDFLNFRHMLESEPWSSAFVLRLGPASSYVRLSAPALVKEATRCEAARREKLERRTAAHVDAAQFATMRSENCERRVSFPFHYGARSAVAPYEAAAGPTWWAWLKKKASELTCRRHEEGLQDLQTLVSLCYDLSNRSDVASSARAAGDDARGGAVGGNDGRFWVNTANLALHIDRLQPGWRQARMAGFADFGHMLESEPWCSAFALGPGPFTSYVRLTPSAWDEETMRREKLVRDAAAPVAGGRQIANALTPHPAAAKWWAWLRRKASVFSRPRQDPQDVQTLVGMYYDMPARSSGYSSGDGEPWVNISDLAKYIDDKKPGWRRTRMVGFINFRHMLESPPWCSVFTSRPGPSNFCVQLTAPARATEKVRRENVQRDAAALLAGLPGPFGGGGGGDTQMAESGESWPPWSSTKSATTGAAEHDADFVVHVVEACEGTHEARTDASLPPPPAGKGWVELNRVTTAIDEAARVIPGKGAGWRARLQPKQGMRALLLSDPYVDHLELVSQRRNASHVDWWVRSRAQSEG